MYMWDNVFMCFVLAQQNYGKIDKRFTKKKKK